MKHLKKFNNIYSLNNYKRSNTYITPNILYNIQTKYLDYNRKLYKYLEYIESSGSNYIELENLNNYAEYNTNATIKFKVNLIEPGFDNTSQPVVFGNGYNRFFIQRIANQNGLRVRLGTTNMNNTVNFNNDIDAELTQQTILNFNDLNYQTYLFCFSPSNKLFSHTKFYYLQLYKDDELVLDLIPVHNIITNENGVLDRVRNKFYGFIEYNN